MLDHFSQLGVQRRPWLDSEKLKQRFHKLSMKIHPDQFPNESKEVKDDRRRCFADLNAAFQCLSNSKLRVRHLLELESGQVSRNVQSVPPEMTNWFTEINSICSKVDAFLDKRANQNSPMLQVVLLEEGMLLNDEIVKIDKNLQDELSKVNESLKSLNLKWDKIGEDDVDREKKLPLAELDSLSQQLSFWVKWSAQLGERSSRLMF